MRVYGSVTFPKQDLRLNLVKPGKLGNIKMGLTGVFDTTHRTGKGANDRTWEFGVGSR